MKQLHCNTQVNDFSNTQPSSRMKRILFAVLLLLFFGYACQKEQSPKPATIPENDSVYLLSSLRLNDALLDTLIYNDTGRLQSLIIPQDSDYVFNRRDFYYNPDGSEDKIMLYDKNGALYRNAFIFYMPGDSMRVEVTNTAGNSKMISYGRAHVGQPAHDGSPDTTWAATGDVYYWYASYSYSGPNLTHEASDTYQYLSGLGYEQHHEVHSYTYDNHSNPFYIIFHRNPSVTLMNPTMRFDGRSANNKATERLQAFYYSNYSNVEQGTTISSQTQYTYQYDTQTGLPLQCNMLTTDSTGNTSAGTFTYHYRAFARP